MKISIVSGGFDPLHSGHLTYLEAAASLGDELWVCLNSDEWLQAKKGKAFMSFEERKAVLQALRVVTKVIKFDDRDGSCIKGLEKIASQNPKAKLIFCNGGDRNIANIPESSFGGIELAFGVGGNCKKNSSSSILASWNSNTEERSWGNFSTLLAKSKIKVKELVVKPKQGMSFQRHNHRSEVWFVNEGICKVYLQSEEEQEAHIITLCAGDVLEVPSLTKHQIINESDFPCTIIEIQYGERVDEQDIERFFYFPETP
jgi:cytidyltransferase-like protein